MEAVESRRLLSGGALDTTFDLDGTVTTAVGIFGAAWTVAVQPDGKIVVAGSRLATIPEFVLARYNTDGSLDASFGTGGIVTTNFGSDACEARDILIQPDGKIVAAGYATDPAHPFTYDFVVARYNTDGSLDSSFGSGGRVRTDFGPASDDLAYAAALQPDGKIVLAGGINLTDFGLVRYNPDGSLDTAFGSGGFITTNFSAANAVAYGIVVQTDGKIVAAGYTSDLSDLDFALARFNSDGTLDSGFSGDGKVTVDFAGPLDIAFDLALQPDGKVLAAGVYQDLDATGGFALARFDTTGALDSGFGVGGTVHADFGDADDLELARSVAIASDGSIVVAGQSTDLISVADFAVARFSSSGAVDTSFGTSGLVTTDFAGNYDEAFGVALQPDGKIVAAGYTYDGTNGWIAVARYLPGTGSGNTAPNADAGGPYAISEGQSLVLDASGSSDPELDILSYAWDIDGDDDFDDGVSGVSPTVSWTQLQSLLSSDDGNPSASFVVKVRVSDGEFTDEASATVSLGNTAPTATLSGGPAASLYNPSWVQFTGASDPSAVDTIAGFTYSFDFNNDGDFTDPGDIAATSSPTASYTFSSPGTYTVRGRITDKDGGFSQYTTTVTVTAPSTTASVLPDPLNPSKSALLIYGTSCADVIVVLANSHGALHAGISGTIQFGTLAPLPGKPFGRVIIHGNAGNDIIVVATLSIPAAVFAGTGHDSVLSGCGNDMLVGGEGNDRLYANSGNDLVIGGNGADVLRGDAGNDVLIAGTTDYDSNLFSLHAIATGVIPLSTSFMHDDSSRDTLTGGLGTDRFFANQIDGVIADIVTDQSGSESWEDLS
ncbi:MAG: PKD domain-containing protein [Phycisphaerales bacterium]|nr:PKD domain-containing protein [Phycisphaerales bacterium]